MDIVAVPGVVAKDFAAGHESIHNAVGADKRP